MVPSTLRIATSSIRPVSNRRSNKSIAIRRSPSGARRARCRSCSPGRAARRRSPSPRRRRGRPRPPPRRHARGGLVDPALAQRVGDRGGHVAILISSRSLQARLGRDDRMTPARELVPALVLQHGTGRVEAGPDRLERGRRGGCARDGRHDRSCNSCCAVRRAPRACRRSTGRTSARSARHAPRSRRRSSARSPLAVELDRGPASRPRAFGSQRPMAPSLGDVSL